MSLSDRDAPGKPSAAAGFLNRQVVIQSASVLQVGRKYSVSSATVFAELRGHLHDEFAAGLAERLEPFALRGELGLEDLGPPW